MIFTNAIHAQIEKGGNIIMSKTSWPLSLTIVYEWSMLTNNELISPLLHKSDHMWDTKHKDVERGNMWTLMGEEVFVIDVTNE